jgi:hypothetical protein
MFWKFCGGKYISHDRLLSYNEGIDDTPFMQNEAKM